MTPKVAVLKINFLDLSDKEKLKFCEWITQHYDDFVQYSKLTDSERRVWNHFFQRPSEAIGYYQAEKSTGDK